LRPGDRAVLAEFPTLAPKLKKKLAKVDAGFTLGEVTGMTLALAELLPVAGPKEQVVLFRLAERLVGPVQTAIMQAGEQVTRELTEPSGHTYRITITLLGTRPPVWRQILVPDDTLDQLHEHIQTAMGWTNSHMHQFRVGENRYADPDLMAESFDELEYLDSTTTRISELMPKRRKKVRFTYEYDFGDSWEHELEIEALPAGGGKEEVPTCLDGRGACPPEDVGGVPGFEEFLDAIGDANHERHDELLEWCGGRFDPDQFDPAIATRRMRKGLPDWRRMR
jgi:hypothetical protein